MGDPNCREKRMRRRGRRSFDIYLVLLLGTRCAEYRSCFSRTGAEAKTTTEAPRRCGFHQLHTAIQSTTTRQEKLEHTAHAIVNSIGVVLSKVDKIQVAQGKAEPITIW